MLDPLSLFSTSSTSFFLQPSSIGLFKHWLLLPALVGFGLWCHARFDAALPLPLDIGFLSSLLRSGYFYALTTFFYLRAPHLGAFNRFTRSVPDWDFANPFPFFWPENVFSLNETRIESFDLLFDCHSLLLPSSVEMTYYSMRILTHCLVVCFEVHTHTRTHTHFQNWIAFFPPSLKMS